MKLQDYNPDFNNIITISQVLDKRGTKQTSLVLDTTNNKFYVIDDDNNAYPLNPDNNNIPIEVVEYLISLVNGNMDEINSSLQSIIDNNCCGDIITKLNQIESKIDSNTIIQEVLIDKPVYVNIPVVQIEYYNTETTIYITLPSGSSSRQPIITIKKSGHTISDSGSNWRIWRDVITGVKFNSDHYTYRDSNGNIIKDGIDITSYRGDKFKLDYYKKWTRDEMEKKVKSYYKLDGKTFEKLYVDRTLPYHRGEYNEKFYQDFNEIN